MELDTRVWRQSPARTFGGDGRSLSRANYYYIYYLVDSGTCTLWAIPINKRREEGSTFFLALSRETARRWKGAALALSEIKHLSGLPEPAQFDPETWAWWRDEITKLLSGGYTDMGTVSGWWEGRTDQNRWLVAIVKGPKQLEAVRAFLALARPRFRQDAMYLDWHNVEFELIT